MSPHQMIEFYSSAGGVPILFAQNDTRLMSPEIRKLPRPVLLVRMVE
jgi:hypothetical protein